MDAPLINFLTFQDETKLVKQRCTKKRRSRPGIVYWHSQRPAGTATFGKSLIRFAIAKLLKNFDARFENITSTLQMLAANS